MRSCYILSSFTDEDVLLKRSHEIDELLSMRRGHHGKETRAIEVTSWLVSADDFSSQVARGANQRVSAANE